MSMPPTPPQYGPYGAPPPGFPPPAQPKKTNRALVGCLGCGGLIVAVFVIVGIVGAISGAGKNTPNSATPPPAGSAVASPKAHIKPPAPPKPRTVLTESGTGTKSTKTFRVHGDWDLHYSYNCSNFGSSGNFQVWGDGGIDVYVNELEHHNSDVTHEHHGGGSMALKINSECHWKIKVVQLP